MRSVASHTALDIQGPPGLRTKRRHEEPGLDHAAQKGTLTTDRAILQGHTTSMEMGWGCVGSQSIIPIPREATSVATMMGLLPVLNSFRTQSRSFCCLSPWIAIQTISLETDNKWKCMCGVLTQCRPTILPKKPSDVVCNALSTSKD